MWSFWQEAPSWINGKPLDTPGVTPVVDQTLTVDGARLHDVQALASGFGALPDAMTSDRLFQAGVHLFGWPPPDKRRRLRKSRSVK